MEQDVLQRIRSSIPKFSKGQKKIASYILDNYDKTAFMTAGRLGTAVGVSESTVVRFAADIGYVGYPEMRRALQDLIKNRLTSVQRIEVSKGLMSPETMPTAVLTGDMERIRATCEALNGSDFDAAADAISRAESIYIMGMRSANSVAVFMGHYLNMLFPNVRVVNESSSSEVFEQILRVGKGDERPAAVSELLSRCPPRTARVPTAPGKGLFLWRVFYRPEEVRRARQEI